MHESWVGKGSRGTRLDSWKAVAQHLGRSSRTAQRWHRDRGLPVHHLGGDSGSVFAYSDEIDSWFGRHRAYFSAVRPEKPSPVLMPAIPAHDEPQTAASVESTNGSRAGALIAQAYKMWNCLAGNNLHTIARLFREVIDLDSGNAEAYAGLSHALIAQGMTGNLSRSSSYSAAQAAADKALEIDPDSSEAICAQAWLETVCHRNWQNAAVMFERVLMDRSVTTRVMVGQALLWIAEGNCESASDMLYKVHQENSLSSLWPGLHSWSEYLSGSYAEVLDHIAQARESGEFCPIIDAVEALTLAQFFPRHEAIRRLQDIIEADPRNLVARGTLGYLWGLDGNETQARSMLELLDSPQSHAKDPAHYAIALTLLGLGEKEQAIEWVKRSYKSGSLWSLGFHLDPVLRSLEQETAFQEFVVEAYPAAGGRAVRGFYP